jgi:hypothetical protein
MSSWPPRARGWNLHADHRAGIFGSCSRSQYLMCPGWLPGPRGFSSRHLQISHLSHRAVPDRENLCPYCPWSLDQVEHSCPSLRELEMLTDEPCWLEGPFVSQEGRGSADLVEYSQAAGEAGGTWPPCGLPCWAGPLPLLSHRR